MIFTLNFLKQTKNIWFLESVILNNLDTCNLFTMLLQDIVCHKKWMFLHISHIKLSF